MQAELEALEQKLNQLVQLSQRLRAENHKLRQVPVSSTSSAKDLGRQMVANVVMLGAMVEGTKILEADQVKICLKESVPPGTEELNLKAFDKGRELLEK